MRSSFTDAFNEPRRRREMIQEQSMKIAEELMLTNKEREMNQ